MGGFNIKFNLSLTKCSTGDCSNEKATYEISSAASVLPTPDSDSNDSDIINSVYASSCSVESATRICSQKGNITKYLLGMKRGSSEILSVLDYDKNFFLCEEYGFDCGYVEN